MVPVTQFSATVGGKTPTVVSGFEFGYVVKCEVCAEKYYFVPKEVLEKFDKGSMRDKAILFSFHEEGKG